jgi:hypothetical protein
VGVTVTPASWYVVASAGLSFTIKTLGGQALIANGPVSGPMSQGEQPVTVFGILTALTWDGTAWHAQPIFGRRSAALFAVFQAPTISSPSNPSLLDAPGCAAMPDFIGPVSASIFMSGVTFMQAANFADGCLAIKTSGTQRAYYLYRFGDLVAVNNLAHQLQPELLVASAHERQVAAAILASGTPAT